MGPLVIAVVVLADSSTVGFTSSGLLDVSTTEPGVVRKTRVPAT
jgi:hypothetical protein